MLGKKRVERIHQILITLLIVLLTIMFYVPSFSFDVIGATYTGQTNVNIGMFFYVKNGNNSATVFVDILFGLAAFAGFLFIWLNRPVITAASTIPMLVIYFLTLFGRYNHSGRDRWLITVKTSVGKMAHAETWIEEWYAPYYFGWILLVALIVYAIILAGMPEQSSRKQELPTQTAGFCPRCGNPLQPNDRFCGKCGMQKELIHN